MLIKKLVKLLKLKKPKGVKPFQLINPHNFNLVFIVLLLNIRWMKNEAGDYLKLTNKIRTRKRDGHSLYEEPFEIKPSSTFFNFPSLINWYCFQLKYFQYLETVQYFFAHHSLPTTDYQLYIK